MRKIALALVLATLGASQASAGVVLDKFLFSGTQNYLKDNSVSKVVFDAGTAGKIDAGDIIQGIIRIDQTIEPTGVTSGSSDQLVVVFSAKVAAPTDTENAPFGASFDLVPVSDAGFRLADMLSGQFAANAVTAADVPTAIFAVLDGSVPAPLPGTTQANPTEDPLGAALTGLNNAAYTLDLIGGILTGDFFKSSLSPLKLTAAAIIGTTPSTVIGQEIGGFSLLKNFTGYSFAATSPVEGWDDNALGGLPSTTTHQFTLTGTLLAPTTAQKLDGYLIGDSTIVGVVPSSVPEPASMLLWTGLAAFAGFRGYRRKTNVVA